MKAVTVVAVLAVIAAGLLVTAVAYPGSLYGIDRFSYSWTSWDCPTGGCPADTLYTPTWCPDPSCEECGAPLDAGSTTGFSSVPTGGKLLWLNEEFK